MVLFWLKAKGESLVCYLWAPVGPYLCWFHFFFSAQAAAVGLRRALLQLLRGSLHQSAAVDQGGRPHQHGVQVSFLFLPLEDQPAPVPPVTDSGFTETKCWARLNWGPHCSFCRSWQTLKFDKHPASFIRIVGTHNTANEVTCSHHTLKHMLWRNS